MTDWTVLKKPENGEPGLVKADRTYTLKRGDAYLYNIGDVHSPSRRRNPPDTRGGNGHDEGQAR